MRMRGLRRGVPAVGACFAALLALSGCVSFQLFGGPPEPLVETVVLGETGPKILLLKLDGVISMEEPERRFFGPPGDSVVSRVREVLDGAREDPEVRALLLRVDSPGGTATASDVVYAEILRFKRERGIPVVAHAIGTTASGGYYVAMAADSLVAHPTTVVGSIGVLFMGVNFAGLMEKLGIENQTLTAGSHKDAGSPLRRMTDDERAQIQSVLDDLHLRFEEVVAAGRPGLDREQVAELADGRIFSAGQARTLGLVDELGDLERAAAIARERAGLPSARVVTYHRSNEYENNLFTRAPPSPVLKLELPDPLGWLARPGFYYLWAPGLQ
jgi:protease-4